MTVTRSAVTMGAILAGALAAAGTFAGEEKTGHGDATGSAHAALTPKEISWGEAPPALPRGAKLAVLQGDPSAAGEVVTVRLKMPKGYTIPPHFHPTDEAVTVLSGSFSMGTGDTLDRKAAKVLGPGGWCLIPKGAHHYAFATADTVVQVHLVGPFGITYLNPKDDPQASAAK